MKALVFVLVLLLVGIVGLGFYRGWFRLSIENMNQQQPSATVTVDKDKIHEDELKAKGKVQSVQDRMQPNPKSPPARTTQGANP